jgi:hypothetical protein
VSFDKKKFMKTTFEPRIEKVPVPDLKEFFEEGAELVWSVRNLSGHELGKVNEAAQRNKAIGAILDGIISGDAKDKVDAIKASIGLDSNTPDDIARRIDMLTTGSVDPVIDQEMAVKICTYYPIEFYTLTNAITRLTGQGAQVKKKQSNSGVIPASETPSPSAT